MSYLTLASEFFPGNVTSWSCYLASLGSFKKIRIALGDSFKGF